jgi:hypothetical protein
MDKWQALYSFFSSFDVPAYDKNVPNNENNNEEFPRITYQSIIDSIGNTVQIDASVWDLNTSWTRVDNIVNAIDAHIKNMGCPQIDGGRYMVSKGRPFAQRMDDPENTEIKRTVLHINFEFLTE